MFGLEEKYLNTIKSILKKYLTDQKVYVSGSRSTGKFKQYSDLDLAIDGNLDNVDIFALKNELFESYMSIDVDIVDVNKISKEFLDVIKDDFKKFVLEIK